MRLPFLLEIGTEEIPDWMIDRALEQMASQDSVEGLLMREKIFCSEPYTAATPRRLVLRFDSVEGTKDDTSQFIRGPAKEIAWNGGVLTNVGLGFVRKHSINEADLCVVTEGKREYMAFRKRTPGRPTREILADALPDLICRIHFPKTMYWTAKNGPRFIRPIRWIVALLGDDVIPFEIAGVKSGNVTRGHRILGAEQIPVTIDSYEQKLRENFVILSAREREDRIRTQLGVVKLSAIENQLVTTLAYLTEYPTVIQGTFGEEFLALPDEVLVTVMRHHQRYFAVAEGGKLAPRFSAVINTHGDPEGIIRRGNERVLRARFNDAMFFWETDQRKKLIDRLPDLAHVTFQAKLGSYLEKTERIVAIVKNLGGDDAAIRAAQLAKCDLTTELVKELPELQGQVGGLYAHAQREPRDVWLAIYWQYFPIRMEDEIPPNHAGRLVSIADRLDTLRGCFGVGLIPTGSRDPFALRRAAQGIVKILVEGKLRYSLKHLLGGDAKLEEFVLDRIRYYFKDIRGFKYDEVNAVLASGWDDLVDVEERLIAVQAVRPTQDFEPLAASFKRIRNILRQAQFTGGDWPPDVTFSHPAEEDLRKGFDVARALVVDYRRNKNYRAELETIAGLRPKVDRFFDEVLVNDPDPNKRQLRLKLLHYGLENFSTIADFSEIVTNG